MLLSLPDSSFWIFCDVLTICMRWGKDQLNPPQLTCYAFGRCFFLDHPAGAPSLEIGVARHSLTTANQLGFLLILLSFLCSMCLLMRARDFNRYRWANLRPSVFVFSFRLNRATCPIWSSFISHAQINGLRILATGFFSMSLSSKEMCAKAWSLALILKPGNPWVKQ